MDAQRSLFSLHQAGLFGLPVVRTALPAICVSLLLSGSFAVWQDSARGKEYWASIAQRGYAVPASEDPVDLLLELFTHLGSRDSQLRDELGYGITDRWVRVQRLIEPDDVPVLLEPLIANLDVGIGETGNDGVLLRSFSALNLSIFASADLREPLLDEDGFVELLDAGLTYLAEERDLRGRSEPQGWLHAAAHTADLLAALARSAHLDVAGQHAILTGVAAKMIEADAAFQYDEERRLANAVLAVIGREDFEVDSLTVFLAPLQEFRSRRRPRAFDAETYASLQNTNRLLRAVALGLALLERPNARQQAARDAVLATLRG